MIRDKFIRHNGSLLHYAKTGEGHHHVLVFHGFGQDLNVFDYFTRSLSLHYTFYIFDLYFHGKSKWNHGEKTLSKTEWKETLHAFLEENSIHNFSLAGFSLGGKFVLATLEAFPQRIETIYLIAPDGIRTSFWYNLATSFLLQRFFKSMILHPKRFLSLAGFLYRTGLVDKGLIRFAEHQMNTEEKRERVYYSWMVFRHLKFDLARVANILNQHPIDITFIVGKYDKVIVPETMRHLTKRLNTYQLEILESGHNGLINQSLPFFLLNDPQ